MITLEKAKKLSFPLVKKKEKLAVIVPYSKYKKGTNRKLGILKNKAFFEIHNDFKITDEELFNL